MKDDPRVKHPCGCITERIKGKITFINMCQPHLDGNNYLWIALQHPEEE